MPWLRPKQVLPDGGPWSHLDRLRAFRPSVLEEPDGTLRMWYSAHDGETGRILEAVQEPGLGWERVGLSIDVSAGGSTDAGGVGSPSVVRTPQGFLMAYTGSDGTEPRLHLARSDDGHRWEAEGPFLPPGDDDAAGATDPCLVVTGEGWWLFYSGHDGSRDGRRAAVMAAVSFDGASWDRLGTVHAPGDHELALSEPAVLVRQRQFTMLYVCDDGTESTIDMATSGDGVSWDRRGSTLRIGPGRDDRSGLRSPAALQLHHGGLRVWYSAGTSGDPAPGDGAAACRLWSTDFARPTPATP